MDLNGRTVASGNWYSNATHTTVDVSTLAAGLLL